MAFNTIRRGLLIALALSTVGGNAFAGDYQLWREQVAAGGIAFALGTPESTDASSDNLLWNEQVDTRLHPFAVRAGTQSGSRDLLWREQVKGR